MKTTRPDSWHLPTVWRAYYRELRRSGRLHGTIKRAMELREQRQPARFGPPTLAQRFDTSRYLIPLGSDHRAEAMADALAARPRIQSWESPLPSLDDHPRTAVRDEDTGTYSNSCTWHKIDHYPVVGSWGRVTSAGLRYHYRGTSYLFRAPHGYRWASDSNGIKLASKARPDDDFHPDSNDLIVDGKPATLRSLTARLRENAARRREVARKSRHEAGLIRAAHKTGLLVCLRDSVQAGNCLAGSTTWARQHKLDPARHYRPNRLLALANGDRHRVALVVRVAARRHIREMNSGACQLADHR